MISCMAIGLSVTAVAQEKPFTIDGVITGKTTGFIYLNYQDDLSGKMLTDSATIQTGKFRLNGKVDGVTSGYITVEKRPNSIASYFQAVLSPGNLKLVLDNAHIAEGVLSGTHIQAEAQELNRLRYPVYSQLIKVNEEYTAKNAEYVKAVSSKADEATIKRLHESMLAIKDKSGALSGQARMIDVAFMDKYPGSFVTAYLMRSSIRQMDYKQAQKRYAALTPEIKNSAIGKVIKKDFDNLAMGSSGAIAYNFTTKELRGDDLSLNNFKGKYVLLDFWASWCIPCRQGNPHLLELYAKYRGIGLEIIGIADNDSSDNAWKNAVTTDQIGVWKHVLRGYSPKKNAEGQVDISEKFGVVALPTKILIDPTGKIVARFLGGGKNDPELDKKLKEIFGS